MSPDNIFASQMWTWPDPVIKRDMSGRVLFINMAFLALYGGTAEVWHGNVVAGWPMPNPAQGLNRFETRIPIAPQAGQQVSEIVYDWIEHILPDGHAMAVARDVTALLVPAQASVSQPAAIPDAAVHVTEAPAIDPAQIAVQAQPDMTAQMPPAVDMPTAETQQETPAQQPDVSPPHVQETYQPQLQAQNVPAQPDPQIPQAPQVVTEQVAVENVVPAVMPETEEVIQPAVDNVSAAPVSEPAPVLTADTTHVDPALTPEITDRERDFERRALPIEDQDSVLGNNWRDAVIAKAVGVESDSDEMAAASANDAITDVQSQAASGDTVGGTDGEAPKILLAEDNAINALLTRTLLEAEGCTVDVVEDGQLAVQAVKTARYDMIFMDMRMPNMDGLEATRKIRALDHASKGLPIVALTANAFDDDRNACFDSGMNDFMTKPVSAEELSEMVKIWTKKAEERLAS